MIRIIFPLLLGVACALTPAAAASKVALSDTAPDSYVVKKGDTLWDISGRFLKQPWRWPEVWRMNREQIHNPHLIYPGQLIVLDRSGPYLRIGKEVGKPLYEKRFPQTYTEDVAQAIPTIPLQVIAPFLSQPLVVDDDQIDNSATIVATQENRVFTGKGDTVFAKDITPGVEGWQVYRKAEPLKDPDTGEVLGYQAEYLGDARVTEFGTPATLQITNATAEIGTGDKMVESERPDIFAYAPHPPASAVDGKVVSIYGGVAETARNNVITISVGTREGMDPGTVLALYRSRGVAEYEENGKKETFILPRKRYGIVMLFRVFKRISYGLVLDTDGTVSVGDHAQTP